jgi:hypothetical protein
MDVFNVNLVTSNTTDEIHEAQLMGRVIKLVLVNVPTTHRSDNTVIREFFPFRQRSHA